MSSSQFKSYVNKLMGVDYDTGDFTLFGNIVVQGNGSVIRGASNLSPISNTDILGNLIGNSITMVGNVITQGVFIGDGTYITGTSSASIPNMVQADIRGNLTGTTAAATGNISANYLIGNGKFLTGIVSGIPAKGNINISGNIFATGNVDASNISVGLLRVYGNATVTGQVVALGNISAAYFVGNGSQIYGFNAAPPATANLNIVGNVTASGNVDAANVSTGTLVTGNMTVSGSLTAGNITANYLIGNGSTLSGLIPSVVRTDIFGNVTAPGTVSADYLLGNATNMYFTGNLVTNQGNAANQAARLALTNIPIGGLVTQTDINSQFLLAYFPANVNSNWVPLNGTNFPVTSVFGRIGDVTLISGTDVKTLGGETIVGSGDITTANINIIGNIAGNIRAVSVSAGNLNATTITATGQVNVVGNIVANYFIGNGIYLVGTPATIPGTGNIDIIGNVVSFGNVDAVNTNVAILRVTGNMSVAGQTNVLGNISANYFIGDGSQITGATVNAASGTKSININGNVTATGNVDAANITANILRVNGNTIVNGQVNVVGNVTAAFFLGNGANITGVTTVTGTQRINLTGNVVSSGNVDASNAQAQLLRVNGNVIVSGQVNTVGNVNAFSFIGNGSLLTGVLASGTQNVGIIGNVISSGNVDAANVTTNVLRVTENAIVTGQVNVTGNVTALSFIGNASQLTGIVSVLSGTQNINITGNVVASGNVDASNVSSTTLRVNSNAVVAGQVIVTGNISASVFIGNGFGITNEVITGTQNINILGNVFGTGNVNAANITANTMRIYGNAIDVGQVNTTGLVTGNYLIGNGSQLTNIVASAGVPSSFVQPSTGFSSNVGGIVTYGVTTTGWYVTLNVSTPRFITIQTRTLPTNPNAPFTTLPANVTQTLANAWVYTAGVWQGTVRLTAGSTFAAASNNLIMGYHTSFGLFNGQTSETTCIGLA